MSRFKPAAFKSLDGEEKKLMDSIERDEWGPSITRDNLLENIDLLNAFQQSTVFAYIESLLKVRKAHEKLDKSALLDISVWTDEDIQNIEEGQKRINEWKTCH